MIMEKKMETTIWGSGSRGLGLMVQGFRGLGV